MVYNSSIGSKDFILSSLSSSDKELNLFCRLYCFLFKRKKSRDSVAVKEKGKDLSNKDRAKTLYRDQILREANISSHINDPMSLVIVGREEGSLDMDNRLKHLNEDVTQDENMETSKYDQDTRTIILKVQSFLNEYKIIHVLGIGATCHVFEAVRLLDFSKVAIKCIRKSSLTLACWITTDGRENSSKVLLEIEIMKRIKHHPNIIRYEGFYEDDEFIYMILEVFGTSWHYAKSGFKKMATNHYDLFEFISRKQRNLTEKQIQFIFKQIYKALLYLKSKNIVHRDLKDENVLIDSHFHVKLIDFGSAVIFGSKPNNDDSYFFKGTLELAPPEVLQNKEKLLSLEELYKIETWSLGIILYSLFFGEAPFKCKEDTLIGKFSKPGICLIKLNSKPDSPWDLISRMLQPSPVHRISIEDIKTHPWLQKYNG